ncbi:glycosyltransferase family 39 protein [Curtobacterium sp. NPDC087080]|uniref:glycosyltransferase family 39 protein n=1 Tax=Curtobacterium sp. NPDC087080 TaxID=3363965 RepID=UPI003811BB22
MTETIPAERPRLLPPPTRPHGVRDRLVGLVRGRAHTARWERPAFLGLLLVTGVLYVVNLGVNGWANAFYSAAVQAGSQSWEAFFYGSSDAANAITVDKPPAFLWVIGISVRLFGLNSWSILVPQALMGVASVAVLYRIVRRRFSAGAALTAGAVLATTPVATLMFRYDNPDALLVLLTVGAIALTLRGIESGRMRWVVWAGVLVGFGFLTKQLQAFLVLPPLVGVYLLASPRPVLRRIGHLSAAALAVVVSAGWWVAIVELVPASARPYVGGSQTNSFLELTFGYNGLGRVTGDETGSVVPGGTTGAGSWGSTGLTRLFGSEFGTQVTWLLPTALVLLVVSLVVIGARRRRDPRLATVLVLGGSLLVTGLVFSFMGGIFHPYYTVALAPYIAGLVGIGAGLLWQCRAVLAWRIVTAGVVALSGGWAFVLLSQASSWQPWIRWVVLVGAVVGTVLVLLPPRGRGLAGATVATVLVAALLGPTAFSVQTTTVGHTGALPSAGPSVTTSGFGGGRGGMPGAQGGPGGQGAPGGQGGPGGAPGGQTGRAGTGQNASGQNGTGQNANGQNANGPGSAGGTDGGTNAPGGGTNLLGGSTEVSDELVAALSADADEYTWAAATVGSNRAAAYQLATGDPVMAIGGYNGTDPAPTLAEFQALVAAGEVHWFIGGSTSTSGSGSDAAAEIAEWVAAHHEATTVDGVTMYDLTPAS